MTQQAPHALPAPHHAAERWTSPDLRALDQLVARQAGLEAVPPGSTVWADAHEELRVADEEIRAQLDALGELRVLHEAARLQHRALRAALGIAALETDRDGVIRAASPQAGALLRVPSDRLPGRPLESLVAERDRERVRDVVGSAGSHPAQLRIGLRPRGGEVLAVDVVVAAEDADLVCWSVVASARADQAGPSPAQTAALTGGLAELSMLCAQDLPLCSSLRQATAVAVRAVTAADAAAVSVGDPLDPTVTAASDDLGLAADGAHVRTGQGPAVDAFARGETVLVDDLSCDERWPRLAAAGAQVRSLIATPVPVGGEVVGVLTVASRTPHVLGAGHVAAVHQVAVAVGAIVAAEGQRTRLRELAENLDRALVARQTIDEAKGVVMAARGCTPDEAFAYLAALSQRRNVKVRDLAAQIVAQASRTPVPRTGQRTPDRRS